MGTIKSINIVVLGNWNKRIFTPQWVSTYLFPTGAPIGGLINHDDVELGYKCEDIAILPKDSLLEIRIDKIESCPIAINILNRIIKELPHTPIKAIGFNIQYDSVNDIGHAVTGMVYPKEFTLTSVKITKAYPDHMLNVEIGDKTIVFNNHYQVNNAALPLFDENLLHLFYTESQEFLKDGK